MLETTRKKDDCCAGHVQCMEDSRRPNRALHCIADENRNLGQPHITWQDTIWGDINLMDVRHEDICLKAMERKEWKNILCDMLVTE